MAETRKRPGRDYTEQRFPRKMNDHDFPVAFLVWGE